jgi:guanylate kinase
MDSSKTSGHLFVISGASGTGKTTLSREVVKEMGLFFSVSATTRPRRSGEIQGYDYHFLSKEEFDKMIQEGKFLEWAMVHGNCYGTPLEPVERHLWAGEDILMDLDTQGALNLKKNRPETVLIFLKPPSLEDLRKRLESRGTDSAETIKKRFEQAKHEIEQSRFYDYVVVNRDLHEAKEELKKIIRTLREEKP